MRSITNTRFRTFLVAICVTAIAAAGCGDSGGSTSSTASTATAAVTPTTAGATATTVAQPVAGGSVTIIMSSEIATVDPVKATGASGSDRQRFHALYGGLIGYDATKGVTEGLQAESLKPKGTDLSTWVLKLRSGIKFSDGTAMTATSVKVNWERAADAANACPCRSVAATIKSMTVVDATTLEVVLVAPNAHLDKNIERVALNYIASDKAIADKDRPHAKAGWRRPIPSRTMDPR